MNSNMKIIVFLFLILSSKFGYSQNLKPTNIFYRTINDKIEIFYDLPRNSDTLDVKIYFRKKSDPKTKYRLKWASGSIGVGIFSGKKKKVVWNYKKEPPYLFTGSGFYYEVVVTKFNSTLEK
jgi:hypothetical protein